MLLLHIFIALMSVAFASYLLIVPTPKKLHASYGFIAATLASGTALVITEPAYILHSCVSGLVYIAAVSLITMRARTKVFAIEALHNSRNHTDYGRNQ